MSRPVAYLAGPDVFLADARAVGRRKAEICAAHGIDGRFPLDVALALEALPPFERGRAIYRANLEALRACDLAFVNLTPFRGPSADAGTVFELGWLIAAGKPVFAYSSDPRPFAERTPADRYDIERFAMADNLMLHAAVAEQVPAAAREIVAIPEPDAAEPLAAMAAFEEAVRLAAGSFPVPQ
jgi:nucleoside 2-deoxyribosyltransferase